MGFLEADRVIPDARASATCCSGTPSASSLTQLLATPVSHARLPDRQREIRHRLKGISFDAFIVAIEHAGHTLDAPATISLYQEWIAANANLSPVLWAAWFNLGAGLARAGDTANAAVAYRNALALKADCHFAAVNLGLLQEAEGDAEEALRTWEVALQPVDARIALLSHKGRLLERLGRLDEAERVFHSILATDPAQPDVIHHWIHVRQKTCQWPILSAGIPDLPPAKLLPACGALSVLALTDDIAIQRAAAESWVTRKTRPAAERLSPAGGYRHDRIRIGYLSSDFCRHAMSYLITELFERHDRSRFEVFGYCASPDDSSDLRRRVIGAFDHYRPIRVISDEEAARLIRNDEIDVLIDLNGITEGTRLPVLRWKPAPLQATYLGYIGAVPLPELDFLLCDTFVIPPQEAAAYAPRPLPVAWTYQANDTRRAIGRPLSRCEVGLPEDRFVFTCFSRHYKITEEVFAGWMRILHRVDGAVLWLATDNRWSRANMLAAAVRDGIAPDRIIFAERTDPDLYMSLLRLGDLFLDTFPYNAGTVASDAIRMQQPLLTLCGRAFASRMAGSLLTVIGAQEGIATSLAAYVEKAVALAQDKQHYRRYKALFTENAWRDGIGDIARFTREFEDTVAHAVTSRQSDQLPAVPTPAVPGPAPGRPDDRAAAPLPGSYSIEATLARAFNLHQTGNTLQAEVLYRAILARSSMHAGTNYCLGHLCYMQGRLDEAVAAFSAVIAVQRDHAEAMTNLSAALLGLNRPAEALEASRRALAIKPDDAMVHGNLGRALQDLGMLDDAIVAYHQAIALQPDNASVHTNLSAALLKREDWEEAAAASRRAIAIVPDNVMAYGNLGSALLRLGAFEEALAACRCAVALRPTVGLIWSTLGGILMELGALEEAAMACREATALDPSLASAHFNLSHTCKAMNQLADAAAACRRAIALQPDCADYHFHLGHILLAQGDFPSGWAEYDWRWKLPAFAELHNTYGPFAQPLWSGESLTGKTILVYTEQGLGDIILFARYLPLVVGKGGTVIVATHPPMKPLLDEVDGITVVPIPQALPHFDVHCPLLTLPRIFETEIDTIPSVVPYLHGDPGRMAIWRRRLSARPTRPLVGIVWAGNPATQRDRFRSPGLASMAPIFEVAGVQFVVLQVGPGRRDLNTTTLPGHVIDLGEELTDLGDTAAVMTGLDLVISSCTGPLHLAGALGRPAWGVIPFAPYFPWLLDRSDAAWYPSMRLYRQDRPGVDWTVVIGRVVADLTAWVAARSGSPDNEIRMHE
jgi:predicted O-linked N-acetylglucosamine transferase (SPINDLY family)